MTGLHLIYGGQTSVDYFGHSELLLAFLSDLPMIFFSFEGAKCSYQELLLDCSIHHQKTIQVALESCCRLKEEGGLGVKDLRVLNKAMLTKFAWRMIIEDSIFFTYLHARYFTQDHRSQTFFLYLARPEALLCMFID